jgi:hypothetical protein
MILTPAQIQELVKIIENQHLIFLANTVGTGILSQSDLDILTSHGIDVTKLPTYGVVDDAFRFGILADALGSEKAKKMSYSDFKNTLKSGGFLPLTKAEKISLDHIKQRTYSDVTGLGTKIGKDLSNIVIENSKKQRAQYEKILQDTIAAGAEKSRSAREIASDLGHATKDWARDFDRIADYVLHEAFDTGKAMSILREAEAAGEEAYGYKEVYEGACQHCISLYLTDGIGSKPRIFKMSTLIANGSNIGRTVKEWKPVIGCTHPWCRCELYHLRPNNEWDSEKKMFVLKRNTYGVTRKSKIKIISE